MEAAAIDTFHAVFSKFGLKKGVIFPTYGLAEHTVYVCSNGKKRLRLDKVALEAERMVVPVDKTSETSIVLMGCGKPGDSDSVEVRIVRSVRSGGGGESDIAVDAHRDGTYIDDDNYSSSNSKGKTNSNSNTNSDGNSNNGSSNNNSNNVALSEGQVGEIWIRSQSMAAGYWGLPDKFSEDFDAKLDKEAPTAANGGGHSGYVNM